MSIEIAPDKPGLVRTLMREFNTYSLADSALHEATVSAPARTQPLASGTAASTFVLADGIASGMPTREPDMPNPCRPLNQIELRRPLGAKCSGRLVWESPGLVPDGS